ncbi:hypothetical protein E3220_07205 [Piscirickettsia salmonis EM-90]|nr:hypothetical protein E3220_07205 [Piscirickettsia salmonis EM-90]
MLEFLSHNCKEKASFFLIVFFNLLIVCQKLLIERYTILPRLIDLVLLIKVIILFKFIYWLFLVQGIVKGIRIARAVRFAFT